MVVLPVGGAISFGAMVLTGSAAGLAEFPAVAVRVTEPGEPAPRTVVDVGHLDAPSRELLTGPVDVLHDKVEALCAARDGGDTGQVRPDRDGRR